MTESYPTQVTKSDLRRECCQEAGMGKIYSQASHVCPPVARDYPPGVAKRGNVRSIQRDGKLTLSKTGRWESKERRIDA